MSTTSHSPFAQSVANTRRTGTPSTSLVAQSRAARLNERDQTEDRQGAQDYLNKYTNFLGCRKIRSLSLGSSSLPGLLLQDLGSDLPITDYIHTTDLGTEVRFLQRALAYFLQCTGGISNDVYDHVGAVGCDIVRTGDATDGSSILNFRLAKNNGLQEEDVKFMGVLLGLLETDPKNHPSDDIERLALRHLLVRVNNDVNKMYKRIWNSPISMPKCFFGMKKLDERYEEYESQELHCLGLNRRVVLRECDRKPHLVSRTEIAKISMAEISVDVSTCSDHLLRLHKASQAARRLLRSRNPSEIRNELRRLLECFRMAHNPASFCSIKEEELIKNFPLVLTDIAGPLMQLEVISGFLGRYRSQLTDTNANVAVKFFALTAPRSPTILIKGKSMSRLTHCEMQVLDYYLFQRRPSDQPKGTRTRIGKFIGISKDCCPLCSIIMGILSGVFVVDGSHNNLSVWWSLPVFLFSEDGLFSQHRALFFQVVACWADEHGYRPDSCSQLKAITHNAHRIEGTRQQ
ncbi:hypothetical protein LZ30DRAFT_800328 [Colletotrichum cereale]|nr:hypothetical protein LZ30DRAFT_800328 [Colletotrichum cereale]